ncbi:hypothetical protein [Legionella jamestowniensis]|uniref:Uncharacterized protein n=1 Tax=Legionella jamestowniensis TaxID=455 RepID=A0A0W0UTN5_9GAMM|nr:hypothetical protein [Legionella jamestowniensis]KTD11235.1 hypothetical protein Ljam_0429 [Legionella jamestowniensis]SFL70201.1 hypothetical protein SAMN02746073_1486 [Legionella jamestowniensis DSM 19215]
MTQKSISPESILADGADYAQFKGVQVRKATVAAFIANIELLESASASPEDKHQAIRTLMDLAPSIVAIGLPEHVLFKNEIVESIIQEAKKQVP